MQLVLSPVRAEVLLKKLLSLFKEEDTHIMSYDSWFEMNHGKDVDEKFNKQRWCKRSRDKIKAQMIEKRQDFCEFDWSYMHYKEDIKRLIRLIEELKILIKMCQHVTEVIIDDSDSLYKHIVKVA